MRSRVKKIEFEVNVRDSRGKLVSGYREVSITGIIRSMKKELWHWFIRSGKQEPVVRFHVYRTDKMKKGKEMKICNWCKEPLEFVTGKGYVHLHGGLYTQRCIDCDWNGSVSSMPKRCPKCGSPEVVDSHRALVVEV